MRLGVHWVCETQTKPTTEYTACVIDHGQASSSEKHCLCTMHITRPREQGQARKGLHLIEVVQDAKQRHWCYAACCQV
jgi:hypothetical protein